MRAYTLTHLSDAALLRGLAALVSRNRTITAALLAHLAEVDARRLYVPAGYPSMHSYCVDELRLSDDAAYKRIQAARAARQFPALFVALADGRLHLTAVRLLAPHVTPGNVDDLVAAATHQRSHAIEELLARRFPSRVRDVPTRVRLLSRTQAPALASASQLAAGQVGALLLELPVELAAGQVEAAALAPEPPAPPPAQERFLLQLAIDRSTHDKLRRAQALVSHSVRPGDIAAVLERALDALIEKCEKRKFAASSKPRPQPRLRSGPRPAAGKRLIPAGVRRVVWARDGGRCTFVGIGNGRRCGARTLLEFDHVDPVARGGKPSVERMRLRCRAHNQYEAERTFGTEFMKRKRDKARRAAQHDAAVLSPRWPGG